MFFLVTYTNLELHRAFSFSFEIAIDAYPGDLGSKETKKNGLLLPSTLRWYRHNLNSVGSGGGGCILLEQSASRRANKPFTGNRTGVLTFHIEGIPDGKVPEAASAPEDEDEQRTRTKKRKTDDSKKNDKDQLLDDLAVECTMLLASCLNSATCCVNPNMSSVIFCSWRSFMLTRTSRKLKSFTQALTR